MVDYRVLTLPNATNYGLQPKVMKKIENKHCIVNHILPRRHPVIALSRDKERRTLRVLSLCVCMH